MKRNVLHVIYSFTTGGAEEVIVNYARAYDKSNYNFYVCIITDGDHMIDKLKKTGVTVFVLKKTKRMDLKTLKEIRSIIKTNKIDILHMHNPPAQNYALIPSLFSSIKIRLRTEHNIFYKNRVMKFYGLVNYFLTIFQDVVIACSKKVHDSQINDYKLPKSKVTTIENGIDGSVFETTVSDDYLEKEFAIKRKKYLSITVGNLIEQKGHAFLIEAAEKIVKERQDILFLIVGDGKLREKLAAMIKEKGLEEYVCLTGKRPDIPELLSMSDIFLLSSLWEGLPIVLLEAMAAKTAIIATDVGGNAEVVKDGQTGMLIPATNAPIMAEKVLQLIDNIELKNQLSENAYHLFLEKYSVSTMMQKTEDLYTTLIKS